MAEHLIHSEEFRASVPIRNILLSMHVSRSEFVRGMPKGRRILDLGGTHQGFATGRWSTSAIRTGSTGSWSWTCRRTNDTTSTRGGATGGRWSPPSDRSISPSTR